MALDHSPELFLFLIYGCETADIYFGHRSYHVLTIYVEGHRYIDYPFL